MDFLDVPQLPGYGHQLEPSRWLYTQICMSIDAFFAALRDFLAAAFPGVAHLDDVLQYQRSLIILPGYNRWAGASFQVSRDWMAYFAQVGRRPECASLPEPEPEPLSAVVRITDDSCTEEGTTIPLDWGDGTEPERWTRWISLLVLGRNSEAKNNFSRLRAVPDRPG